MQADRIIRYLKEITVNNNREWYQANKGEYDTVRRDFEAGVAKAIMRISTFDESIAHLTLKDCTYRFNRDTRFSPDKSPYKRHFGAYIAAHGKKAFHGGYYLHLEPDHCLLACGNYYLPTPILTSCRNEIMANIDEWRAIVEDDKFMNLFGKPGGEWDSSLKGFGIERLKSSPNGFPRDYAYVDYLRMKDYCCWKVVANTFFNGEQWLDEITEIFQVAKPMMDFINRVIDDYE